MNIDDRATLMQARYAASADLGRDRHDRVMPIELPDHGRNIVNGLPDHRIVTVVEDFSGALGGPGSH